MGDFANLLSGGDLRSLGESRSIILNIQTQKNFDQLFQCLFHKDRLVVMRAADAIEKITINNTHFLAKHTDAIIELCNVAVDKELKWHLALIIPRLHLNNQEFGHIWNTLTNWAKDKTNSRIVRVNSIQALFEMTQRKKLLEKDFSLTLAEIEKENIPSINARIRKFRLKGRLTQFYKT